MQRVFYGGDKDSFDDIEQIKLAWVSGLMLFDAVIGIAPVALSDQADLDEISA